MIEINCLKKKFGKLEVLKGIDICIEKGDIFGIVGISGAGKSTLLRCINGLEKYDEGSLKVDNVDLNTLSEKSLLQFRKNIGMIFQDFALLERLNVEENVGLPMVCWKVPKEKRKERVEELLELVGLSDKKKARPKELSGGQKQRVAIARALAMNPRILLCDEATSALDPNTTSSILELLRKINKELGITIVMVTHQMSVVKQICNRMAVLREGKLDAVGDVKEIFLHNAEALRDILGNTYSASVPDTGVAIEFVEKPYGDCKSVLSGLGKELGIEYELLSGSMDKYREQLLGSFVICIDECDYKRVQEFLDYHHVDWRVVGENE